MFSKNMQPLSEIMFFNNKAISANNKLLPLEKKNKLILKEPDFKIN